MVLGVLSGGGWWQHAEQVVAPRAGAIEEQEPRCLEVVQGRDLIQKSLVAGPGLVEVVSLVFWCAKGGSEDSEPSLLGRECRVSDPNVGSKRFQVGRRDARKVPDSGFATVELDVRVVVEVVCQKIVHRFHPMWLDHCVDIIEVSIKAFPFLKLGLDGLDCSVLPQGKQCGHEGVALLATLGLLDDVGCVGVVVPHVCGGLGVEKSDEWQASVRFGHGLEALKHAVAGDGVVGTNPIDRQDGAGRVLF